MPLAAHTNGELSAPVLITLTVVSDTAIPAPWAEVYWGTCAMSCGVSGLEIDTLEANQPVTLTVTRPLSRAALHGGRGAPRLLERHAALFTRS